MKEAKYQKGEVVTFKGKSAIVVFVHFLGGQEEYVVQQNGLITFNVSILDLC